MGRISRRPFNGFPEPVDPPGERKHFQKGIGFVGPSQLCVSLYTVRWNTQFQKRAVNPLGRWLKRGSCSRHQQNHDAEGLSTLDMARFDSQGTVLTLKEHIHHTGKST